jgi:hypothetical protein
MRKKDELSNKDSCMQRAHQEEMVFVLLSRDAAAPAAIRAWVQERIRLGKNVLGDLQITKAVECADIMEREFRIWAGVSHGSLLQMLDEHYASRKPRP